MERQFVEVLAYDGTLARVPSDKAEEFRKNQEYIKLKLASGKTLQEILSELKTRGDK